MPFDRVLANLDLNLLPALDALVRERNVTRTAEHPGVSQPAASAALARLRRHFDDPLLTRVGNRYELTARLRPDPGFRRIPAATRVHRAHLRLRRRRPRPIAARLIARQAPGVR